MKDSIKLIHICKAVALSTPATSISFYLLLATVWWAYGWRYALLLEVIRIVYGLLIGYPLIVWACKRHPLYYLTLIKAKCGTRELQQERKEPLEFHV